MSLKEIRLLSGAGRKLYVETYGCQMNVGDSEIVVAIMQSEGWIYTDRIDDADLVLINTCSVRDSAEQRIWAKLGDMKRIKRERHDARRPTLLVGVIGCMAERLKEQLMERNRAVDIVSGPDSYRNLPSLVESASGGARGVNTVLSAEETYGEISPVRLDRGGVSAFVSIMRGCNNMCSYCVVPFTRGRERSRDPLTILREVHDLFDAGYREVTLLGQNVNSYSWVAGAKGADRGEDEVAGEAENMAQRRERLAEVTGSYADQEMVDFPTLLRLVAEIDPLLRVRFSTSHPKDLSDKVLEVMASMPNICRSIHLPAQSGSSRLLELMNRGYSREWYLDRIAAIRRYLPDATISTDILTGFCGETEDDHALTLSLMRDVGYEQAYMYKYSERPQTKAARKMKDDVSAEVKSARLSEIIALQHQLSLESNKRDVGKRFEVLIESVAKRGDGLFTGRTSQNKVVVFDNPNYSIGDYIVVKITDCSLATLRGEIVE